MQYDTLMCAYNTLMCVYKHIIFIQYTSQKNIKDFCKKKVMHDSRVAFPESATPKNVSFLKTYVLSVNVTILDIHSLRGS